jgi:hypothetical protein
LLTETSDVRLSVLAGIIDATSHYPSKHAFNVISTNQNYLDSLVHLSRGLGFSTSAVERNGMAEDCIEYTVRIIGRSLGAIPLSTPSKCSVSQIDRHIENDFDPCSWSFRVTKIEHADYFGFELDSNRRCLLADFTITHNSGALHVRFQNSTPFQFSEQDRAVDYFGEQLTAAGYNYVGTETMYSGITGTPLRAEIFIGLVYYQRLRHMVSDKSQVRATGPVNAITHQPIKGRKVHGGIRFGEMERDSLLGHGTAFLLQDRLLHCSDYHVGTVCTQCGSILSTLATGSSCRICATDQGCTSIALPYVFFYLVSELAALNIRLTLDVK